MPDAFRFLVRHGRLFAQLSGAGADHQVAIGIDEYAIGVRIFQANLAGIGSGATRNSDLSLGSLPRVRHVDSGVQIAIDNAPIRGNAGVPGGRIVADQEIGARGHRVQALDMRRAGFAPAKCTRIWVPWIWKTAESSGESGAQLPRLRDIANRGIGLAGVGDEEYGKRVFRARLQAL